MAGMSVSKIINSSLQYLKIGLAFSSMEQQKNLTLIGSTIILKAFPWKPWNYSARSLSRRFRC